MKRVISSVIAASLMVGCGAKNQTDGQNVGTLSEKNPLINAQAATAVSTNPLVKLLPGDPNNNDFVAIKKVALGHLFLMTVAQVDSFPTPTGHDLAGKVVFFEKQGNSVYLFESSSGKVVTSSIATKVLLAEFPIIEEKNDEIKFNFKEGMNKLVQLSTYYSSEPGANGTPDEDPALNFDITKSYINKVELRGKHLFIDQYALAEMQMGGKTESIPVQVKYTFSSYVKNPNFTEKESTQHKGVGFFEAHPKLIPDQGNAVINILKFDHSKPITYHLSKNIPADYKEAVLDGVLYWNQVFGKEMIKVDELPANITVHEPGYNIVQWVDWETAGFAYANMQADPLTGETTQAHVYMTSTFASGGIRNALKYLQKLIAGTVPNQQGGKEQQRVSLNLKGFKSAKVCHIDHTEVFTNAAKEIIKMAQENEPTIDINAMLLRFSQDYVREVIAHEVGHTLGMRHNFAGNLGSNLNLSNYDELARYYFVTGKIPEGLVPSTTVMDYSTAFPASMLGAHIRLKRDGLPYDKAAIDWAYNNGDVKTLNFGPFCTDNAAHANKFADCVLFDYLNNTIEAAYRDTQEVTKDIALTVALSYGFLFEDKDPAVRLAKIKQLSLPAQTATTNIAKSISKLVGQLTLDSKFLGIQYLLGGEVNDFNEQAILNSNLYLKTSVAKELGGLDTILLADLIPQEEENGALVAPIITRLGNQVVQTIANLYRDRISSDEYTQIGQSIGHFMMLVERDLVLKVAPVLSAFRLSERDEKFVTSLTQMVDKLLFTKVKGTETPYFDFKRAGKDLRTETAKLLSIDYFAASPSLFRKARKEIMAKHQAEVKSLLGENINVDNLTDAQFDWLTTERAIFAPIQGSIR